MEYSLIIISFEMNVQITKKLSKNKVSNKIKPIYILFIFNQTELN